MTDYVQRINQLKEYGLWAIAQLLFAPFMLARPCGPARNCIGWRQVVISVAVTMLWVAVLGWCVNVITSEMAAGGALPV